MSYLSVFVQYHAAYGSLRVPAAAFEPAPEVDWRYVVGPSTPTAPAGPRRRTPLAAGPGRVPGASEDAPQRAARQLPVARRAWTGAETAGIAPDRRPQTVAVEEWLAADALGPIGAAGAAAVPGRRAVLDPPTPLIRLSAGQAQPGTGGRGRRAGRVPRAAVGVPAARAGGRESGPAGLAPAGHAARHRFDAGPVDDNLVLRAIAAARAALAEGPGRRRACPRGRAREAHPDGCGAGGRRWTRPPRSTAPSTRCSPSSFGRRLRRRRRSAPTCPSSAWRPRPRRVGGAPSPRGREPDPVSCSSPVHRGRDAGGVPAWDPGPVRWLAARPRNTWQTRQRPVGPQTSSTEPGSRSANDLLGRVLVAPGLRTEAGAHEDADPGPRAQWLRDRPCSRSILRAQRPGGSRGRPSPPSRPARRSIGDDRHGASPPSSASDEEPMP